MRSRFENTGAWLLTMVAVVVARWNSAEESDRDRGDVPGWVMITVMSAILVVVILGVFRGQVESALTGIFDKIK